MGNIIHLLIYLCTLYLSFIFSTNVNLHRRQWIPAHNRTIGTVANNNRRVRAVNRPMPIDCKLGSWSTWTPCNPCTDQKSRFRYLEKPSQFGGTLCFQPLWETLACPRITAQCLVPDYCGESFTCKETGRCISHSLRCNGEADCDDFSDEDGCEDINQRNDKCSTLLTIPGAERGTQGYNVLTGEFVNHVLDSKYFGGKCEYVYNGEWRKFTYDSFCENLHYNEVEKNYRKPYNYHAYSFVAEATSEGTQEYYGDVVSLLNARKSTRSSNAGVSVGVYYVQVGLSGSEESEFLRNVSQHKKQDLGFIRLWSTVGTAYFKMRSNRLMLYEDFQLSLMELPEQYDFGIYSRFFDSFGTHYVTEGKMGGTLEYVVVVNKTSMTQSKLEWKQAGSCIGASLGLSAPVASYGQADLTVGGHICKKDGPLSHARSCQSMNLCVSAQLLIKSAPDWLTYGGDWTSISSSSALAAAQHAGTTGSLCSLGHHAAASVSQDTKETPVRTLFELELELMDRGPAGEFGLLVHQRGNSVPEPVIIHHLLEVELHAWAPPLRLSAVEIKCFLMGLRV
ncbi:complement component C8 alpha chain isoform X3 [Corythoichthys intestinalis]|uniref:complement component C8 alpha chain isoform X3 n=1 Tax=Corythoichthys intestinalis TaxID=161448 RepID=UPI0025A5E342|nr:complement component C8 alpha chain isoform X3 [Corythoichthys intestinalis]